MPNIYQSMLRYWLDLDVKPGKPEEGYENLEQLIAAFKKFVEGIGLPLPTVVNSGYGLHIYWQMQEPITRAEWEAVAIQLKALCRLHGFKADPKRTADCASIMRAPDTNNYKNPKTPMPVLCRHLAPPVTFELFKKLIFAGMSPVSDISQNILGGLSAAGPVFHGSIIASRCKQLGTFRDKKGCVSEPVWYGALGVLGFCQDGEKLASEWSSGYPQYNAQETSKKLEQWRNKAKPTTCAYFKDNNPSGCEGCPLEAVPNCYVSNVTQI